MLKIPLLSAKRMAGINFYAQNEKYVDIIKSAIIDPTTYVRATIQNVASVAGQLITTESMVTELPEKESMPLMPSSGGMGGMGEMDF